VKKFRFVALAILLVLIMAIPAVADQVNVYKDNQLIKSVVFKIGTPYYVVNGQTPGVKMDVAPFIQSDRTFVPVRFLGNALGLDDSKITWDNGTQTATLKGDAILQMTIGKASVTSNGVAKQIDVAPVLKSDRTFLPARYVAEGLGYEVGWDDATQTVVCWPAGQPQPDVSAAVDWLNNQEAVPPAQSPVTGSKINGYTIPAKTDLKIANYAKEASDGKWMVFSINLKTGDLQQQYADAQSIMLQTVDRATVAESIDYAKKMQDPVLSPVPVDWPPTETFNSPNGMAVRVGVGGGYSIQFDIWSTK
jgi:hypothetical protein